MIHRRKLLTGLGALIAAPAIVRVSSIMPVKIVNWKQPDIAMSYDGLTWHSFGDIELHLIEYRAQALGEFVWREFDEVWN